jgi:hypothetical protein
MTFFEWVWKWLEKRDDERAERAQICTREHKCSIDGPCNGYPRWTFIHRESDAELAAKIAAHRKEMGI